MSKNYCLSCKGHIEGIAKLSPDQKGAFCFNCQRYCTKCGFDTHWDSFIIKHEKEYSFFCNDCHEEYMMYLNPPCHHPSIINPTDPDVA